MESSCKDHKEKGIVQVSLSALTQELECSDVFVHISFLHAKFLELFLCSDVLSIINKGCFEPVFENLPSILSQGNETRIPIDIIKPVVHLLNPSFDLWSIN